MRCTHLYSYSVDGGMRDRPGLEPHLQNHQRRDAQTYDKLITIHQLYSVLIGEIHQCSLLSYAWAPFRKRIAGRTYPHLTLL